MNQNAIKVGAWYLCKDGAVRQVTYSKYGKVQWFCLDPGVQWTPGSDFAEMVCFEVRPVWERVDK